MLIKKNRLDPAELYSEQQLLEQLRLAKVQQLPQFDQRATSDAFKPKLIQLLQNHIPLWPLFTPRFFKKFIMQYSFFNYCKLAL